MTCSHNVKGSWCFQRMLNNGVKWRYRGFGMTGVWFWWPITRKRLRHTWFHSRETREYLTDPGCLLLYLNAHFNIWAADEPPTQIVCWESEGNSAWRKCSCCLNSRIKKGSSPLDKFGSTPSLFHPSTCLMTWSLFQCCS